MITGCVGENLRPYGTPGSAVIKNMGMYLFSFHPSRIAPENKVIENYLIVNNLVPPECEDRINVIRIGFSEGGGGTAIFVCNNDVRNINPTIK